MLPSGREVDMAPEDKLTTDPAASAQCLLTLRSADGSITSVGPLSRDRADALAQAYGRMGPDQACWVEPLRREVEELHVGRVRRVRRPSTRDADRDH
jgi:hypothetical protein